MVDVKIQRNAIFKPVWESRHRYIVMLGSAGSGKSVDTRQRLLLRLISDKGRNLLCIRKVAQSNKDSTFNELRKAAERMGVSDLFKFRVMPLSIKCRNGNEVIFGGVNDDDQREKLKSITAEHGNITDIWIEEATEITQNDFEIIDDRLRGDLPDGLFFQITMTFNPVSANHWIKKVFWDRPDPNVLCHKSTYLDNRFIDEAYYERMERRKEVDPEGYQIYGLGEWGETSGLIFSNYKVEELKKEAYFYDYVRYGHDFGFNHADACLKVGFKDDEVYVIQEIYEKEKTTDDIIAMLHGGDWDYDELMYCDSAEPDRITQLQRAGFNAVGVKKHPGSVLAGIDWLKTRKIHIDPSCVGTISEISSWRWKKDKDGVNTDVPVPYGDDAMAALRYACCEFIDQDATLPVPPKKAVYFWKHERPENLLDREPVYVI